MVLAKIFLRVQSITSHRKIAWLRWEDRRGYVGWGEIAPLTGRNRETLQGALAQVEAERAFLLSFDPSQRSLDDLMQRTDWFPSVAFALESAFLQIQSPWGRSFQAPTSALLMGTKKEIEAQIPFAQGASIVKLKLAQLTLFEAKELLEKLPAHQRLRIDANRTWSKRESLSLAEAIQPGRVQYFEEPFASFEEWKEGFPVSLAIDESCMEDALYNPSLLEPYVTLGMRWIVYKPSVHGGRWRGQKLFLWAQELGVRIVLGSSFESPLGIACICDLARRLDNQEVLGVGTLPFITTSATWGLRYSPPFVYIPDCI